MTADWTVLDIRGVRDIATKAAHAVCAEYRGLFEVDDLHQDALIVVATNADIVRQHQSSGNLGLVYRWLWCRLVNSCEVPAAHSSRTISWERITGDAA